MSLIDRIAAKAYVWDMLGQGWVEEDLKEFSDLPEENKQDYRAIATQILMEFEVVGNGD